MRKLIALSFILFFPLTGFFIVASQWILPVSEAGDEIQKLKIEDEKGIAAGNPDSRTVPKEAAKKKSSEYPNKTAKDPVTGMEFVFVKGGCFQMGDTLGDGENNERPVHEVCLDDFYIGKYEVTNLQFSKFVEDTGYMTTAEKTDGGWGVSSNGGSDWGFNDEISWKHPLWPSDSINSKMDHPVVQVSRDDVEEFVKWLNRETGMKYRLPTEAEWEYAARDGGKNYKYSWGTGAPSGNIADEAATKKYPGWTIWDGYDDNYVYTAPAGSFKPNELGIYDMTGNVWEWIQDNYNPDAYKQHARTNPVYRGSKPGEPWVNRGGSWFNPPKKVRLPARIGNLSSYRSFVLGFRLVNPVKDTGH